MWSRLDDRLIDHRKILQAGKILGPNGPALALGFFALGLMWCNKHLTDGHLPRDVVEAFPHVSSPKKLADIFVKVGLWEPNGDGYLIHDFAEFNLSASEVKAKRRKDLLRKRHARATKES
jgi:hypothetical protein